MLAVIAGNIEKDKKNVFASCQIFVCEWCFVELVKSKSRNSLGGSLRISFKR